MSKGIVKNLKKCPVCNRPSVVSFGVLDANKEENFWYWCSCGCIFNGKMEVDRSVFNDKYIKEYTSIKGFKDRLFYMWKTYLPVIEEATYGRKFLDIGPTTIDNVEFFRKRGWISDSIDLIPHGGITADFETYNFKRKLYDFIYMGDVLQSFNDPRAAIKKAYDILDIDGILLITTPSSDIMYQAGLKHWGHWNTKEHFVYFSNRELEKQLSSMGFDIVMKRENYSRRFISHNNQHVIVQKFAREEEDGKEDLPSIVQQASR